MTSVSLKMEDQDVCAILHAGKRWGRFRESSLHARMYITRAYVTPEYDGMNAALMTVKTTDRKSIARRMVSARPTTSTIDGTALSIYLFY